MVAPELPTAFGDPLWRLLMALGMGALIGIERERRKGTGVSRAPAGLRTFALIALLGGLAGQSESEILLFMTGAFTALVALAGYWLGDRHDPGVTTEVAMFATFLLGVEAQHNPGPALALAVIVTVLLAWREPLHRLARDVLSERELHNGLIFAIAALVVLPLLPDRAIDPFGLFNPFALWRIAVVVMGLSAGGHAAARIAGPRYGLAVAGLASGFISSSATIASMGSRARATPELAAAAAAGAVASTLGALLYLAALVAAANIRLLLPLAVPIGSAAAVTLVYTVILSWRIAPGPPRYSLESTAFDFRVILLFAFFLGAFSLIENAALHWFGSAGVLASAIATGAIDVHAAATAVATVVTNGDANLSFGVSAILLALTANMLVKMPLSFVTGTPAFATRVCLGLALLVTSLWGAVLALG
ncbi:MAG: MgtC/SapB family protein [Rhizomicrobium sp.]